jgi:hypothetical protein
VILVHFALLTPWRLAIISSVAPDLTRYLLHLFVGEPLRPEVGYGLAHLLAVDGTVAGLPERRMPAAEVDASAQSAEVKEDEVISGSR